MKNTKKLIKDLIVTEDHTGKLESEVKKVRTNLDDLHDNLSVSKKINQSLEHLDSSLDTAKNLLTVVSVIPNISSVARKLNSTIKEFHKPIKSAIKASNKVEKIVKPIRRSIEKIQPPLRKLDQGLLTTMNIENNLKDALCSASKCINSLPDSKNKTLLNSLETAAKKIDPKVLEFDKIQVKALSSIEEARKHSDEIGQWAEQLFYLNIEVNNVINILKPLISALNGIKKVLNEVIKVPYGGYPDFCTEDVLGIPVPYPCGWVTVYFSFSIQQILDGVKGVVKPVLDLLDDAMSAILDPLLNALNLNIELPSIPNLKILETLEDKLKGLFEKLMNKLESIPKFDIELNAFINELKNYIKEVLGINTDCLISVENK